MENFFWNFPQYGKHISTLWKTALPVLMFVAVARAERPDGKRQGLTPAGIERLGMWCEFMPYAEVEGYLPALAEYDCELILHVERESFGDPDFPRLLRAAEQAGVGVDAWLLLPYEEHLYVGQASVASVRNLARRAADFFGKHHLKVRAFVFDCEPSPLLGAELFAAARRGNLKKLAGIVRRELDAEAFERDTAEINALVAELRGRGYAVDGAANRAFLDAQSRGNVALEDGLNAPVSAVGWDALSFITYRYGASALDYVAMLNRYASLARRLYGERAALDVGLLGDYDGIPENAERAALFGGEEEFMAYLRGMRSVYDLEEAVGVVLGCGVRRINVSLDTMDSELFERLSRRDRLHCGRTGLLVRLLSYGLRGGLLSYDPLGLFGEQLRQFRLDGHACLVNALPQIIATSGDVAVFSDPTVVPTDFTVPGVRFVAFGNSPQPTHGVDVTGHLDAGIASLREHRVYLEGLPEGTMGTDPEAMLRGAAEAFGPRLGVELAVPFEVIPF